MTPLILERSLEETLARAVCEGFWQDAPKPLPWSSHSELQREVFRLVARRVVEDGRALQWHRTSYAEQVDMVTTTVFDAFYEVCEQVESWERLPQFKRDTFVAAAKRAVLAGRAFRNAAEGRR